MRFADDIVLLVEQTEGLQKALTGVAQASQKMGMKLNIQKTECLFLGAGSKEFHIEVDGQELEQTENFVYLGGNIITEEGSDKDVERSIDLAKGIWQALGKMWSSKDLSKATKKCMYGTLVLSVLLSNRGDVGIEREAKTKT